MAYSIDKDKVKDQYDRTSPYMRDLWGEHIHHGYWINGDESKERAQLQLIEHLAKASGLKTGARLVDVGCGLGGSSIYLAKKYAVDATGITISPIQVEMARKAAETDGVNAQFVLMDAEEMSFAEPFDVVWSIESISHYPERDRFFRAAAQCLKSEGTFALIDWFKKENLTEREHKKFILPIEEGMMVKLEQMSDYGKTLASVGFQVTHSEVMNKHCAKTWDLCLKILKNRMLWKIAAQNGRDFVEFLRAFTSMRAGFKSGAFVYGMIVANRV